MKKVAVLAVAAFVVSIGSASACEWSKRQQSVKAPEVNTETSTVATVAGPQSTPVNPN